MQNVDIEYVDGEITVSENEPSTLAECIELLGSEAAVVDEVTSNLRYRNKYPRVYRMVSKAMENLLPREVKDTKTLKDGTVKQVLDSEMNHLRALLKLDAAKVSEILTPIAQSEPLYVKGERTGGGGKISAAALNGANEFFARGDDAVEGAASKIEELVPGYKVGRDADKNITPESLARAISALDKHLLAQAKAQTKSLLG